jgi:DNA sulfur modification protein DndC
MDELHEIRRIWLNEKHEFDDSLPGIYQEITGQEFPGKSAVNNPLRADDWSLLKEVCGDDEAFFDLQVGLLGIEQSHRGMSRRAGIFEKLEKKFRAGIYSTEHEAVGDLTERERRRDEARGEAKNEPVIQARASAGERQLGLLREDLEACPAN